jgi:hypothetical protein
MSIGSIDSEIISQLGVRKCLTKVNAKVEFREVERVVFFIKPVVASNRMLTVIPNTGAENNDSPTPL